MLNSGMVSKDVVEVSYQGLEVDYNEGLTCSGLKFSGSTEQDYAYYLDHNGKRDISPNPPNGVDRTLERDVTGMGKGLTRRMSGGWRQ